ncbi:unnamed protein product [Trifolium pratense]|uniref:Uncharacterized protein n=1 Tax=Trifolium pratense TaxID=57577 RepID=A0ACB0JX27_TRIPR|nr:unnamed protein product [Trifolium pratense]
MSNSSNPLNTKRRTHSISKHRLFLHVPNQIPTDLENVQNKKPKKNEEIHGRKATKKPKMKGRVNL